MERNEQENAPAARKHDPCGCPCRRGKGSIKILVVIWATLLLGGVGWLVQSRQNDRKEAEVLLNEAFSLYGQGDIVASTERLRRSAELGNAWAQLYYGERLLNGFGTERNLPEAVKWFREAAAQRCPEAFCQLAACYENGAGVEKDLAKAETWYREALEDSYSASGAKTALERIANLKVEEAAAAY